MVKCVVPEIISSFISGMHSRNGCIIESGKIGGWLGSIFGTSRKSGQRLSTGQRVTREVTRTVTNKVAGGIAAEVGRQVGGSMGGSIGRAIVRGMLGGILR